MADENEPGQAAPDAKPEVVKEKSFQLLVPVMAHGEQISKLTCRRPTGNDIMEAGYPLKFDDNGDFTFDEAKMGAMMVRLAAVPLSTIKNLDGQDWTTVAMGLVSFFPPRWQAITQS